MREFSKYRLRHALFTFCMSALYPMNAQPSPGARALQRWQHTSWIGRDGAPTRVMAMEQTADGVLWLGSRQGLYRSDGKDFSRVSVVDEGPSSPSDIYALKALPNGDLWIGQFVGGAMRLRGQTVTRLHSGLPRAGVTQFSQDRSSQVWASPPAGLARFDGKQFHSVGPESGLPTGMSLTAALDGRGNLLVRTYVPGLFVLHPGARTFERVTDGLRLTYRYQLAGYDRDWQLAGTRNAALYTDLPPGKYFFQSQSSYDGVNWSPSSAVYALRVPPAFSQRLTVKVATALLLLTALWGFLRWRFHRAYQFAQLRLQERVQERERIARDMHDTLLQGVQGLILRFGAIADSAMYDDVQRDNMQRALQLAEHVVAEGRDRVRDLRKQSDDANRLEECLAEAGTVLALSSSSRFQRRTLGTKQPLHPLITDELCMIGREALQNAFQYAQADTVEVRLDYSAKALSMSVQDDGAGLSDFIEDAALVAREGHWGLKGMRERAERVGARFHIESWPGKGCTVQVSIAASLAFTNYVPLFRVPWRLQSFMAHVWRSRAWHYALQISRSYRCFACWTREK